MRLTSPIDVGDIVQTATPTTVKDPSPVVPLSKAEARRRQLAVGIGNFMEWFDFAVYGYFAAIIGAQFFPSDDPTAELLSSLAVFAVGFVARPVGALILGPIGDKWGRKQVLVISVAGMGLATALIGLTPSYAAIGIAAPILIVIFRLVQGMMVGGEWSSAATYLGESAPPGRRALHGSIVSTTAGAAFLAGTLAATLLTVLLSEDALSSWGWRVPFVASFVMAIVALYIRRNLEDTSVFAEVQRRREVGEVIKPSRREAARSFVLAMAVSSVFGVSLYYFVTYANNHLSSIVGMDRVPALTAACIALVAYVIVNPLFAMLSDRFGRRPVVLIGSAGLAITAVPVFMLLNTGSFVPVLTGLVILGTFVALTAVSNVVLLVEVFPANVRSTGSALGHNLALALLAGPGPLIAAALINSTGNLTAPAYYLAAVSLLAFIVLWRLLPETNRSNISN